MPIQGINKGLSTLCKASATHLVLKPQSSEQKLKSGLRRSPPTFASPNRSTASAHIDGEERTPTSSLFWKASRSLRQAPPQPTERGTKSGAKDVRRARASRTTLSCLLRVAEPLSDSRILHETCASMSAMLTYECSKTSLSELNSPPGRFDFKTLDQPQESPESRST